METWRKFLNEGPIMDNPYIESEPESDDEPDEGYFDYDQNPDGFDPDAFEKPSTVSGETSQGIDTTLDLIMQGAPEHLIQAQAEIEGLSLEEVEDLREKFVEENEDAFEERYGDDPEFSDPEFSDPEFYVSDDSES